MNLFKRAQRMLISMPNKYGLPITIYTDTKTWDLFEMYRQDVWGKLNDFEREDLLQETANRLSVYNDGNMHCSVALKSGMPDYVLGGQLGDRININQRKFSSAVNTERRYADENWLALETILHETRHVWQDSMAVGSIPADNETRMRITTNGLDIKTVNGVLGSQYLSGVKHQDLYYLNPTELDAHAFSQDMTAQIMEKIRDKYGEDESMRAYEERLEKEGYAQKTEELISKYGKDAAMDVSNSLINHYYGTHIPISNPQIDGMVEEEMIASHASLSGDYYQLSDNPTINGDSVDINDNHEISDIDKIRACDRSDSPTDTEENSFNNDLSTEKSDLETMHDAENSADYDYRETPSYTPSDYENSIGNSDNTNSVASSSNSSSTSELSSTNNSYSSDTTSASISDESNEQSSGISM